MFTYTMNELIYLLIDRYQPEELVELLCLNSRTLVSNLTDYIGENFESIHGKVVIDEEDHFGIRYGEDNE